MKVAPRLSNDNFAELTDTLDWNQNFVKQLLMNVEFDCFVGYLVKTFSEFCHLPGTLRKKNFRLNQWTGSQYAF